MTKTSDAVAPELATSTPPVEELGPDIQVSALTKGESASFWAELSATDDSGISVDGIKDGDEIRIEDASGACAFEDNRLEVVLSIVAEVTKIMEPAWKTQVTAMRKTLGDKSSGANGGKKARRLRQESVARELRREGGGIVVCLPEYGGTVYANDETHAVRSAAGGRVVQSGATGYFFPGRTLASRTRTITSGGVMRITVFDGNHSDNAGSYEVKFTITRRGEGWGSALRGLRERGSEQCRKSSIQVPCR